MVVSPDAILAVLVSLTPWHGDVGMAAGERELLLAPVASAISRATDDRAMVAALIAQASHETRLASPVLRGRCDLMPSGEDCDHGRARGPWQVWRVACAEAYEHPDGSHESIADEARCAAKMLGGGRSRCRSWEGAFAAMTGGARCSAPWAARREHTRQAMMLRLDAAERE